MTDHMHNIMSTMSSVMIMRQHDTNSFFSFMQMLLGLLALCLVEILTEYLQENRTCIATLVTSLNLRKKKAVLKVNGSICMRNNVYFSGDLSLTFRAVMLYVYNSLVNQRFPPIQYNVQEEMLYGTMNSTMNTINIVTFTNASKSYSPYPRINLKLNHQTRNSNKEKNDYTFKTFAIEIYSENNSYETINAFVNTCIEAYEKEQSSQLKHQHIFVLSSINESDTNFHQLKFNTSKTFDNMFFDEKIELKHRLDYFMNNADEYRRLGIPYTFGMLFHGTPGTGKTSAIKAIANYTKRHIVTIPVSKIKNAQALKDIFLSTDINGVKISNEKRLYVFEEIDCGAWKDILMCRHEVSIKTGSNYNAQPTHTDDAMAKLKDNVQEALISVLSSEDDDKSRKRRDKHDEPVTLGDFLELLDGIIEIPGRMIILTSNHPERLDPALIRPGRVDMVIEFKKLSRMYVAQMFELWFNKKMPSRILDHIRDYQYSQAEIGYIFALRDQNRIYEYFENKRLDNN